MRRTFTYLLAASVTLVPVAAWAGVGYGVYALHAKRRAYEERFVQAKDAEVRGESVVRLRAALQATEVERAAIEGVSKLSVVQVAEIIERAGTSAGAKVQIGEATTKKTDRGFTTIAMRVQATGSFQSLLRAASLFETLPVPSVIERMEFSYTDKAWALSASIAVTIDADKR